MKLYLLFTGILAKRKSSRAEFTTDFPFDLITDYTTELPADFVIYFATDSSTDSQTDEDLEQEGFTTDYPMNITSSTEAPISSTTIPTSTSSTVTSTTRTTATSTTETSTRSTISTTTSPEGSSGDSSDDFTTEYPDFGSEDFTTDSLLDFTSPSEEPFSSTLSTLTSTSTSTTRLTASSTTESQTKTTTKESSTESTTTEYQGTVSTADNTSTSEIFPTSTSSTATSTTRTTMTSTTENSSGDFTTDYPYFGSGDYTTDSLEDFTSTSEEPSSSTLSTLTETSTSSTAFSTVDSTRPPPTCLQNTAFGDIFVWKIAPGMDKPSPYSNFEYEIANFAGDTQDCQRECANFAGCYKLHHDVDNNICELRGDEISFSEDGNDYAVSGKSCESGYEWIDYAVNLEFYCLFSTSQTPEDFLAMLNSYNPPGWVTYTSIGFAYSYEFAFELATNVPWLQPAGPNQIWIAFVGELHIRFENFNYSRKRRFAIPEVEVDSVVQDVAANATTEFQSSIDAGNATVAITTNTTVEVEDVAPVIDPLDPTSTLAPTTTSTTTTSTTTTTTTTTTATTTTSTTTATSTTTSTITTTTTRTTTSTSSSTTSSSTTTTASTTTISSNSTGTIPQLGSLYDALESVLSDAVADHPNNKLKNFYKIKARFGWFNDYVETPCVDPAGAGPGIPPDFVEPTISTNDPCLAAETFYNALLGFYDDFVCLDRIRNRGITKNVDNKLEQAKDLFNRILRKTTCPLLV